MFMLNFTFSPLVNSVSYGDVESSISKTYADRVNVEFMKFGALGRSLLFASGDDGVGCNSAGTKFEPNWPASSPYVTSVGGTFLQSTSPVLNIESDSISSGGFSNYFAQPTYQSSAVAHYLATSGNLPPSSFYSTSGRAFPDISAFSENVLVVYHGFETPVGGTSCAAPVVSALFSLINDGRLAKGNPALGYLNTQLYIVANRFSDAFYDVTTGPNNGAGSCSPGFAPAPGWDPITGLGVPNYVGLKKAFDP
jgi:tripeptidyl-peptidase-1